MTNAVEMILVCIISVLLGGVVVPLVMNWLCDRMGWFK